MQSSVIGTLKNKNHNGFTLLEILVVLVIMAIVTTVAMLSLNIFSHARQMTVMTQQLVQTIKSAEMQAVLRPQILGLRFNKAGYRFYEFKLDNKKHLRWLSFDKDKLSQPHIFAHHLQVNLMTLDGQSMSELAEKTATIVFSPNGNVSPFSLLVTDDVHDRAYRLTVNSMGEVNLQSGDAHE